MCYPPNQNRTKTRRRYVSFISILYQRANNTVRVKPVLYCTALMCTVTVTTPNCTTRTRNPNRTQYQGAMRIICLEAKTVPKDNVFYLSRGQTVPCSVPAVTKTVPKRTKAETVPKHNAYYLSCDQTIPYSCTSNRIVQNPNSQATFRFTIISKTDLIYYSPKCLSQGQINCYVPNIYTIIP